MHANTRTSKGRVQGASETATLAEPSPLYHLWRHHILTVTDNFDM